MESEARRSREEGWRDVCTSSPSFQAWLSLGPTRPLGIGINSLPSLRQLQWDSRNRVLTHTGGSKAVCGSLLRLFLPPVAKEGEERGASLGWSGGPAALGPHTASDRGPGEDPEGLSLTCQERCSRQIAVPSRRGHSTRRCPTPHLSDGDSHLLSWLPQAPSKHSPPLLRVQRLPSLIHKFIHSSDTDCPFSYKLGAAPDTGRLAGLCLYSLP